MPILDEAGVIRAILANNLARPDVALGPGDDAAILAPDPGRMVACAMDTLNEGVHFPAGLDPAAIGHRALAVNLSDLAAMGAEPAWATLSLSIAEPRADWVAEFARGLQELARRFGVALVGGDTVTGPLSIAVHLSGFVEPGTQLTRSGARPGDRVYVTGCPGAAAYGLSLWNRGAAYDRAFGRFAWPEPRVEEGAALRGLATACIDISDGLATDLARLASASSVRISIDLDALPVDEAVANAVGIGQARELALTGGDDYELCFTVPPGHEESLEERAAGWPCGLTRIGTVVAGTGLEFVTGGRPIVPDLRGSWSHFGEAAQ